MVATPTPAENRIWLLKPRALDADNMPACVRTSWAEWVEESPWDFGSFAAPPDFVIEAPTEQEARALADREADKSDLRRADECMEYPQNDNAKYPRPWLNAELTTCEELVTTGVIRVIARDFYAENQGDLEQEPK